MSAAGTQPSRSGPVPEPVVGAQLPSLEIPVTRTLIVAGAIASRDFEPVHHDHVIAQERGSADLFMNILTSNGLVGRYVTDWAGPGARLRSIQIRLGVPNYPGDTMRLTGEVVEASGPEDGGGRRATVAVRAANELGDHASGRIEVEWP